MQIKKRKDEMAPHVQPVFGYTHPPVTHPTATLAVGEFTGFLRLNFFFSFFGYSSCGGKARPLLVYVSGNPASISYIGKQFLEFYTRRPFCVILDSWLSIRYQNSASCLNARDFLEAKSWRWRWEERFTIKLFDIFIPTVLNNKGTRTVWV